MKRAKSIMSFQLVNNKDAAYDVDRGKLAGTIESWFPREKKRDDPVRYTTVEEQRDLRLKVVGDLLGRGANNPLTSFNPQSGDEPNNMGLVEAVALQKFVRFMSFDVHDEVKAEYQARSRVMLDEKEREFKAAESERRRMEAIGQVDGFGDIQLYLSNLQPASTSAA